MPSCLRDPWVTLAILEEPVSPSFPRRFAGLDVALSGAPAGLWEGGLAKPQAIQDLGEGGSPGAS